MRDEFEIYCEVWKNWGITLTDLQKKQFLLFYEKLIQKNKVMNLTTITEFHEVMEKHFFDSIVLGSFINLTGRFSVLDLGTGAGFPGIPLKIVYPDLNLTLVDSLKKRVCFLDEVIGELSLKGISTVHARAEELAFHESYREKYDLCVSRAVANLSTLSEYCLPFVSVKGRFVSYKSGEIQQELYHAGKAVHLLGGSVERVEKFHFGEGEISRSFVIIQKKKKTPKMYPRKAGIPSRNPLSG